MYAPRAEAGNTLTADAPCDACVLLDDDATPKPVRWCATCEASLCERCERDYWRRMRAALLRGG